MMDAVRIRLDPSAREPLWEQLRSALASRIASGRLAPGERMPTVRELAAQLEIAPNTAAKAYRDLATEGFIVGRGRRGTFVSERLPTRLAQREARLAEAADMYVRRARQLRFEAAAALDAVAEAVGRRGSDG
jgi:DNA-binding transcriptional regulator YhcF (GntR family)